MRLYKTLPLSLSLTGMYVLMAMLLLLNQAYAQNLPHYKLGADDVISISVFDEPDLSLREARISSTGTIAMPLIGQVNVKGLSVAEAERKIFDLYLGDYLKKPDITITIVEFICDIYIILNSVEAIFFSNLYGYMIYILLCFKIL